MIVRIWHGRVTLEKHAEYLELMQRVALPDYRAVKGNRDARCLYRREGDIVHFLMVTTWDDMRAIQAFAGEDAGRAKYYDFDDDFLMEKEPVVQHYDVA
ncbi:MAG TPA: antibiotic biosynthesis monooxygenase [Gammaproteobacteria bacterium]